MPGRGRDIDMLDADAVERHWRRIIDPLKCRVGDLFGKTLTHVYSVSWEGAFPTWAKSHHVAHDTHPRIFPSSHKPPNLWNSPLP